MSDHSITAMEFAREYAHGRQNGMEYIYDKDQGRAYRGVMRKLKAEGVPEEDVEWLASEAVWLFTTDDQR